jgi:hypothetical protein
MFLNPDRRKANPLWVLPAVHLIKILFKVREGRGPPLRDERLHEDFGL